MLILKKTVYYLVLPEQDYVVWDHPVMEELLKHLFHTGSERGHCCGAEDGTDLAISCQPKAFHGKPPCKAFPGFGPADLDGLCFPLELFRVAAGTGRCLSVCGRDPQLSRVLCSLSAGKKGRLCASQ